MQCLNEKAPLAALHTDVGLCGVVGWGAVEENARQSCGVNKPNRVKIELISTELDQFS